MKTIVPPAAIVKLEGVNPALVIETLTDEGALTVGVGVGLGAGVGVGVGVG